MIIQEEISKGIDEAVKIVVAEKEGQVQEWKATAIGERKLRVAAELKLDRQKQVSKITNIVLLIAGGVAGYYVGSQ